MSAIPLEDRLAALESEVASLKAKVEEKKGRDTSSWKQLCGTFANDPAFLEAMRYGKEYRQSFDPKPSKRRKR